MVRGGLGSALVLTLVLVLVGHALAEVCVEPPAGLVSWWPGDGNADDAAGDNDATLVGGATFAPGKVGPAFALDGVEAYVDAGNAPSLHVSPGDFTIEAWVLFNALGHPPGTNRLGAPQGDVSILDTMSAAGINVDGWRLLKQADHRLWFCLGGVTGNRCIDPRFTLFSTTVATTGTWYHLAVVKRAIDFSLYVNGQREDTRSPVPDFLDTHSGTLRIGSHAAEGAHLNGVIDEVAVYDRALSPTEIQAIVMAGDGGKCKVTTVLVEAPPAINPGSRGVIPVSIRTTGVFDAATVNPATVRFGRTGTEAAARHARLTEADRDGRRDLLLHFETADTEIRCDDAAAFLTGRTYGGQAIAGSDSIRTVGCR